MKTTIEVNLPQIITVTDYHEFDYIEETFKLIKKDFKCEEIGFYGGEYIGILYLKKDNEFNKLKKQIEEDTQKEYDDLSRYK